MNGISSVTDSPRPGQAHPVVTPEDIVTAEAIVNENRRVVVNEIAAHLNMCHGSSHHIVRDVLQFHKMFSKLQDKKYLRFSFDSPSYVCMYVGMYVCMYVCMCVYVCRLLHCIPLPSPCPKITPKLASVFFLGVFFLFVNVRVQLKCDGTR